MKKFLLDENDVYVCKKITYIRHILSQESEAANGLLYFNEGGYINLN